jgi:predicted aconitase with swiveling domain
MDNIIIQGDPFVPGSAKGIALVSNEPLSFWGGYDWKTGEIIDRRHPLSGQIAKDRILAIPFTRGSSTTTSVLLEAVRAKTSPAAIITTATDFFFALASVVADELYAQPIPLVAISESDFARLQTGDTIAIEPNNELAPTHVSQSGRRLSCTIVVRRSV